MYIGHVARGYPRLAGGRGDKTIIIKLFYFELYSDFLYR
jgi:hypothetical protein